MAKRRSVPNENNEGENVLIKKIGSDIVDIVGKLRARPHAAPKMFVGKFLFPPDLEVMHHDGISY